MTQWHKRGSLCQAFVAETVETGNKNLWSKPRMFCEQSLGTIKLRTFPKRVGPRILSLQSVDYLGASEHFWVVEKKKIRIFISKTAMVVCCKLSLYANGLVMSMRFIFGDDWNDVPCKSFFFISGNDVISLESRPLNFRVFIHAFSLRPQTYFRSSLTRVLNQFRNK